MQGRQKKPYSPSMELTDSGGSRWQTQANVVKLTGEQSLILGWSNNALAQQQPSSART